MWCNACRQFHGRGINSNCHEQTPHTCTLLVWRIFAVYLYHILYTILTTYYIYVFKWKINLQTILIALFLWMQWRHSHCHHSSDQLHCVMLNFLDRCLEISLHSGCVTCEYMRNKWMDWMIRASIYRSWKFWLIYWQWCCHRLTLSETAAVAINFGNVKAAK